MLQRSSPWFIDGIDRQTIVGHDPGVDDGIGLIGTVALRSELTPEGKEKKLTRQL